MSASGALGEPSTTGIPNRKGFDEWFGYLNQTLAHDYYPTKLWRNEQEITLEGNLNGGRKQYSHDLFTQEAMSFVERHRSKPFFLYLAYTIPHANNELTAKTGDGMEVPDYGPYAGRDWPGPEKGKAAMITRMDGDIGRIMQELKRLGLDQQTLVLFTSDNGPHHEGGVKPDFFDSNGPLRGGKRDLYEGGIRVPMIVRGPGRVPAGRVSEAAWAMWDFLPTACDLVGQPMPAGIDGVSMLPLIEGRSQTRGHEFLYWEFHEKGFRQAVVMGDWKAVRMGTGGGDRVVRSQGRSRRAARRGRQTPRGRRPDRGVSQDRTHRFRVVADQAGAVKARLISETRDAPCCRRFYVLNISWEAGVAN